MKITTASGEMILEDDAIPGTDDMNSIIDSLTTGDVAFQRLCDASTAFPDGLTNAQFRTACLEWQAA